MPYELEQGDVIAWAKERAVRIAAGALPPYHGAFGDLPYCLEFMGGGDRDGPHLAFAREHVTAVQALRDVLALKLWEAAAVLWYREVFSALRSCLLPGAPVLMCAGDRTDDLMAAGMRAAGLEVRTKLIYMYGSAMAVGHDLGQSAGSEWGGYNTRLKPAYETLIYATNPIPGTLAEAAHEWGTIGLNIDACRIARGRNDRHEYGIDGDEGEPNRNTYNATGRVAYEPHDGGRWPATIMLQHADECGEDRCVSECPIAMLDLQSGFSVSRKAKRGRMVRAPGDSYGAGHEQLGEETNTERGHSDSGGASRFFYTSKVQAWEREAGLDGMPIYKQERLNSGGLSNEPRFQAKDTLNPHPTLKSIRALVYLLKLVGRPPHIDSRLIVPCAGTGSEMIAGLLAGWRQIDGVELDQDSRYPGAYVPIGLKRLAWWSQFKTYEDAHRAHRGDLRFAREMAEALSVGQGAMFS